MSDSAVQSFLRHLRVISHLTADVISGRLFTPPQHYSAPAHSTWCSVHSAYHCTVLPRKKQHFTPVHPLFFCSKFLHVRTNISKVSDEFSWNSDKQFVPFLTSYTSGLFAENVSHVSFTKYELSKFFLCIHWVILTFDLAFRWAKPYAER